MIIKSKQIKGKGRGKEIGFPTINLEIPKDIILDEGVYAGWFTVDNKSYQSAIHFGSIPTFDENDFVLEAHLLDMNDYNLPDIFEKEIEIDILDKIRDLERFLSTDDLIAQIHKDIEKVRLILD